MKESIAKEAMKNVVQQGSVTNENTISDSLKQYRAKIRIV